MDRCEEQGCVERAEGWVYVQWTIADFARWDLCHKHLWMVRDDLETQVVAGVCPQILEVHYYEPFVKVCTK